MTLSACGICQSVNCVDELILHIEGQLSPTYTVELTTGEITKIANCPTRTGELSGGLCMNNQIIFTGNFEKAVKIKLTQNGKNTFATFQPVYEPYQPQGQFCGTCKRSRIVMQQSN